MERNNRLIVSPEEMDALVKIKEHRQFASFVAADQGHDWNLLRYLRARKLDVEKAVLMLSNSIDFFRKKDLKKIREADYSRLLGVFRKYYVHGGFHEDLQGRPVGLELFSRSDPEKLLELVTAEEMEDYFIAKHEKVLHIVFPLLSERANRRVDQVTMIADINDLPLLKVFRGQTKGFMRVLVTLNQDYYPEMLGRMHILNAPIFFKGIWAIVRTWFDPRTGDKIEIHSDLGLKSIKKDIDLTKYPKLLGGASDDDLRDNPGFAQPALIESLARNSCFLPNRSLEFSWFYQPAELAGSPRPSRPLHTVPLPISANPACANLAESIDFSSGLRQSNKEGCRYSGALGLVQPKEERDIFASGIPRLKDIGTSKANIFNSQAPTTPTTNLANSPAVIVAFARVQNEEISQDQLEISVARAPLSIWDSNSGSVVPNRIFRDSRSIHASNLQKKSQEIQRIGAENFARGSTDGSGFFEGEHEVPERPRKFTSEMGVKKFSFTGPGVSKFTPFVKDT